MSVRKAASELVQADLFPADAAAAKARRDRSREPPWCADCGVNTLDAGEWYVVKGEVWAAAKAGRPGEVWEESFYLCIGCLEQRLGRRLVSDDFTDARVNDLDKFQSRRLRDRLTVEQKIVNGASHAPRFSKKPIPRAHLARRS
jgi:hypothetical protein